MSPKFSLQPVLDYRHNQVEALEIEFGNLLSTQKRGIHFLEELYAYQNFIFDELYRQQSGDMNLLTVTHLRSNLKTVEDRIRQQINYLADLERQVEKKRNEVVGARQDEETLVKLKEKENERFQVEQTMRDNRLQDDIYIAQAFRRTNGS